MDEQRGNTPPVLLIRADAGTRMGTGHVMRCIALAQAWEDMGGKAEFLIAGEAFKRVSEEGFTQNVLYVEPGGCEDLAATRDMAKTLQPRWVVLDGYHFGPVFQKGLKDGGFPVLAVDDNGDSEFYFADIVVNQNLHASPELYANRLESTRLLLGPQYAFLRREFRQAGEIRRLTPAWASRVLVTLGGSDPDNATRTVIQALGSLGMPGLEAVVAAGAANPHLAELEKEAVQVKGVRLVRDARNMAELMAWAHVAISAGGSTCWELAAMGLPALIIVLADNQANIAAAIHKAGAGINLGWHGQVDWASLAGTLREVMNSQQKREAMTRAAASIANGNGCRRVAGVMLDHLLKNRGEAAS